VENAKKILEDVRLYTDYWGFPNTFSLYLDKSGELFEDKNIRGFADFKNYRFIVNYSVLDKNFTREEIASILAFLQPYANFFEETGDEFRLRNSKLFPGVCKKVELEVGKRLEKVGYRFSEIEGEMFSILADDSNSELIRGFRIAERIAGMLPPQFPKKDFVYKAIIKAANTFESLDEGFEKLLEVADKNVYDVYVLAGQIVRELPLDVTAVEENVNNIYRLIGEKAQCREIKLGLKELDKLLERSGASKDLREAAHLVYSSLDKDLHEWDVLSENQEHIVRELLETIRSTFIFELKVKEK